MAPQLAWLGLGNMGRGMCKNLISKGSLTTPLILYNRTTSRATSFSDTLPPSTSKVVSTLTDAVSPSDIIFTCLGDDASVLSTIDSILSATDVKGKLFVDCSTIHPDTTAELEKKITEKGAEFVAMPVFGAPAMAEAGTLVAVPAGPAASVKRVLPYTTNVTSRAVIDYSGQPCSQATLLKVIGNTFILNMVEVLSEGHVLAEKTGLGSDNLHAFLEQMFPGPYAAYSSRMMAGDYYQREQPLFHVDLARKDARHAMNLAERNGCSVPALKVADKHLEAVKKELGDKGDIPSIYGAVRAESGLNFKNKE